MTPKGLRIMWRHKTEIDHLNKRIIEQAEQIERLQITIREVSRQIANGRTINDGTPYSNGYQAALLRIQAALLGKSPGRLGKARQRSVAVRYDGTQVGRRKNTDD